MFIEQLKKSVVKIPNTKLKYSSEGSNDFCLFILTFGRPNNVITLKSLLKDSVKFNQDYYLVCSDDDECLDQYIENFGERVIIFNKSSMLEYIDRGDNFDKFNVILYARNICFTLASMLGYKNFCQFDDDYYEFAFRYHDETNLKTRSKGLKDLDQMLLSHVEFLNNTPCNTVTMSQMGDYVGGFDGHNRHVRNGYQRKVMNSFFCSLDKPFLFYGSINEDVNFYVQNGRQGNLTFNLFGFALNQKLTQQNSGGMTEQYKDSGTYLKSFYSVMYNPSCVKIGTISSGDNSRFHHRVDSETTYAKILDKKYKENTVLELKPNEDW